MYTLNKEYRRSSDGRKLKPLYTLTFNGTILNYKGSPYMAEGDSTTVLFDTSGTFYYPPDSTNFDINDGQYQLTVKQEMIRELFSRDGSLLEVSAWNGMPTTKCRFRLKSIEFPQNLWYRRSDYVVSVETDELICSLPGLSTSEDIATVDSGNIDVGETYDIPSHYKIEDCSDTFALEMDTENYGLFKATRTLSAKGYRTWDSVGNPSGTAVENAKAFVRDRLGFNPTNIQSGAFGNLSGQFSNYNHYRTENSDSFGGTYQITETWLLASGNYYEDYSADIKTSINDPFRTVGVQGTINGLTNFNVGTNAWTPNSGLIKYNNASGAWNSSISGSLYIRAQQYIGIPLNPTPVNQTVTHSFTKGVISYNYEFNDRPLSFVSGAVSETLSVIDTNPSGLASTVAAHLVLNRAFGPVLQNINCPSETKRSVSYECVLSPYTYSSGTSIGTLMGRKPREQVNALLSGLIPSNYASGYLFVVQDEENYNPLMGRYSRNYVWLYERNS